MDEDNGDKMLLRYMHRQLLNDVRNSLFNNIMIVGLWKSMKHELKTDIELQIGTVGISFEILSAKFFEYDKMTIADKETFISAMSSLQEIYWKMQNTMLKESSEFGGGKVGEAHKKIEEMLKKAPPMYG